MTHLQNQHQEFLLLHYMKKILSIISSIETLQEGQALQRNESFIENVIESKSGENKNFSATIATIIDNSTLSQFYHMRNNYLSQWETLHFQSNFATFVNKDSNKKGYGLFTERNYSRDLKVVCFNYCIIFFSLLSNYLRQPININFLDFTWRY